jgi:CheY-like chemotaxis protein
VPDEAPGRHGVLFGRAVHLILVIEHDTWAREDLVTSLKQLGYNVRHASNGFSGLRLARDAAPDVIVLGQALPDLPSDVVREQLEGDPATSRIPIICARESHDWLLLPSRRNREGSSRSESGTRV